MSTDRSSRAGSPGPSWLLGTMLIGWVVVYNAMRFAGSSPRSAAWISLAIGGVAGLAVFGAGVLAVRRLAAAGRVVHRGAIEIPSPGRLSSDQRDAVRIAAVTLAALAAVALVVGVLLGADYLSTDAGDRSVATAVLAAWDVLVGIWLGDEALRLRRGEAEGIESVGLGCGLTAVLAGVGLSRDLLEPGHVALIVLAGLAGAAAGAVVWRLQGARGLPGGAIMAGLVAIAALVLPLVT